MLNSVVEHHLSHRIENFVGCHFEMASPNKLEHYWL